jgi:hypothetical protein
MSLKATTLIVTAVLCLAPVASHAALAPYAQDFEGLALTGANALANDGWLVYDNVFALDLTWLDSYGPYAAPNDGSAFCALVSGEGGPLQGAQQLSVFSDYNSMAHEDGYLVESLVYREQTIAPTDVGKLCVLVWDARHGDWCSTGQTVQVFVQVGPPGVPPLLGFPMTIHPNLDMTDIPDAWGNYSYLFTIEPGWDGQVLRFGFASTARCYAPTMMFYDNVRFCPDGWATPALRSTWGALKSLYR